MVSERVDRLLAKAEEAADRGDVNLADMYRVLADQAAYHAHKETKALNRMMKTSTPDATSEGSAKIEP